MTNIQIQRKRADERRRTRGQSFLISTLNRKKKNKKQILRCSPAHLTKHATGSLLVAVESWPTRFASVGFHRTISKRARLHCYFARCRSFLSFTLGGLLDVLVVDRTLNTCRLRCSSLLVVVSANSTFNARHLHLLVLVLTLGAPSRCRLAAIWTVATWRTRDAGFFLVRLLGLVVKFATLAVNAVTRSLARLVGARRAGLARIGLARLFLLDAVLARGAVLLDASAIAVRSWLARYHALSVAAGARLTRQACFIGKHEVLVGRAVLDAIA